MTTYSKDPDSTLDYVFDWAAPPPGPWLTDGETIEDFEVTVATGLTLDSQSATDDTITVWLSGGTAGTRYTVACRITTSAGRTDERTFTVSVRER